MMLFSVYIVYDTVLVMKRCTPDDTVTGVIGLFTDFFFMFAAIFACLLGGKAEPTNAAATATTV